MTDPKILAEKKGAYIYPLEDMPEATQLISLDAYLALSVRTRQLEAENKMLKGSAPEDVTSARGDKLFTFMSKDPCRYQLCEVTYAEPVRALIVERDFLKAQLESKSKGYGPRGQCKVHGCEDPAVTPDGLCNGHFY